MNTQPFVKSKDVARRRLKSVLMSDRNGITQGDLKQIQKDIESVLGSYLSLSGARIELSNAPDGAGGTSRQITFQAKVESVLRSGIRV